MNPKLRILVCIASICVLPVLAGDGQGTASPVTQRLREIDLSLTIRLYERVKMEELETRQKLESLNLDEEAPEAEREKQVGLLQNRLRALRHRVDGIRRDALAIEARIAQAKPNE